MRGVRTSARSYLPTAIGTTDLGADPSTAQLALVDLAVRLWAILDSADSYIVSLPSPVDRRHSRLWAVVVDRTRLHAQLESTLCKLGLEKRAKNVTTLGAYLDGKGGGGG